MVHPQPNRYTDYFAWLLKRSRLKSRQIRLTGDITSYALYAETLGETKPTLNNAIPVKPVFLMRDPGASNLEPKDEITQARSQRSRI